VAYAYQQKAVPLIKDAKYAEAFALENRAAELDPQAWLAYRGFLKCIFTKDYEGAISDFQQVARLKPGSREMDHTYPFFEGLCNLELGNYQRAEANFKEEIRQQKGPGGQQVVHFNTLFYVGVLYLEMKNYAQAQRYLAQCLKAYPQHPEANYYLGLTEQAKGNQEAARRYLLAAQKALASGYRLNEDNIYYANYPRQITDYEISQALR
jgi:tetratricopeptide (TPR) repeat protein